MAAPNRFSVPDVVETSKHGPGVVCEVVGPGTYIIALQTPVQTLRYAICTEEDIVRLWQLPPVLRMQRELLERTMLPSDKTPLIPRSPNDSP